MEGSIYVQIWHCYRLPSCGFWCHVSYSVLDWYHFVRWICCLFQKWVFSKTLAPVNRTTSLKIMNYILNFLPNIGTYQPNYIPENYELYLEFSSKHWHLSTKLHPWRLWFTFWNFFSETLAPINQTTSLKIMFYILNFLQNIGTYQPNCVPEDYELYLKFSSKHWHLSTKLHPWKLIYILNFLQNIGTYQQNCVPENYDLYLEFLCSQGFVLWYVQTVCLHCCI
jgi:hypothetical protein